MIMKKNDDLIKFHEEKDGDVYDNIGIYCEDKEEMLVFIRNDMSALVLDGKTYDFPICYEIDVMDKLTFSGYKNRFKRAFKAFFGKPIYQNGVVATDRQGAERIKKWLRECLKLIEND